MTQNNAEVDIALASPADVPGILALQERNQPQHGGSLSASFSREWFTSAVASLPVVVARANGTVVGYAVTTTMEAQAHIPIVQSMLAAYPPSEDSYMYGPICVADSQRRGGVAKAMVAELRRHLPGRQGHAFIRADNAASRRAHKGMGLDEAVEFSHAGVGYVAVVIPRE